MTRALLLLLMAPLWATAEPTAGKVVAGSAVLATPPNPLNVSSTTPGVINWSNFSISKDAAPKFVQPAGTTQLNRVQPSMLPPVPVGNVMLANPSAVVPAGMQTQPPVVTAPASANQAVVLPDGRIVFRTAPQ